MKKMLAIAMVMSFATKAVENEESTLSSRYGMCAVTCPEVIKIVDSPWPDYPNNKCVECALKTNDSCCLIGLAVTESTGYCVKQIAKHWIAPITGAIFNFTVTRRDEARSSRI